MHLETCLLIAEVDRVFVSSSDVFCLCFLLGVKAAIKILLLFLAGLFMFVFKTLAYSLHLA